jgi:hypothetical protein
MPRKGDIYGERGQQIKIQQIREALELKARSYIGEVLLVPNPHVLAEAINRSTGYLYAGILKTASENYTATLEEATGLTVIHKGGLVLGGEVDKDFKGLTSGKISELAAQLPPEQKAKLIGQLASSLTQKGS